MMVSRQVVKPNLTVDLATRVRDLNNRLQDIRREQTYQRVCITSILGRLSYCFRNERRNSAINPRRSTPVQFIGLLSRLAYLQ